MDLGLRKLIKCFLTILFFLGVGFLIHITLVSIVTFFHLQLDHRFIDIQDWIFVNGWSLHIVKLVISFFLTEKFLGIFSYDGRGLVNVVSKIKYDLISHRDIVLIISLLISLAVYLNLGMSQGIQKELITFYIVSYLGHVIFFLTTALLFLLLCYQYELNRREKIIVSLLLTIGNFLCEKYLFKLGTESVYEGISFLLFIIYIISIRKETSLKLGLLLTVFVFAPLMTFAGMDIIWGSLYSPLQVQITPSLLGVIGSVFVVFFTFQFIEKRKFIS